MGAAGILKRTMGLRGHRGAVAWPSGGGAAAERDQQRTLSLALRDAILVEHNPAPTYFLREYAPPFFSGKGNQMQNA